MVPAALTLLVGTRGKLKTSHLLRDSVVRYDKDPQAHRSVGWHSAATDLSDPMRLQHHHLAYAALEVVESIIEKL